MTERTRRRHPAQGGRIAAVGAGMATMFGLIGAMGIAAQPATVSATTPPPVPSPPAQVVVVRRPAGSAASTVGATTAAVPIALVAQPTVVPSAAAPVAQTNGSN